MRLPAPISKLWHAFDGLGKDTVWTTIEQVAFTVAALGSFMVLQRAYDQDTAVYGSFLGMYGIIGPLGAITFAGPGLALIQERLRYSADLDSLARNFVSMALMSGVALSGVAIALGFYMINLTPLEIVLLVFSELFFNSMLFVGSMLVQAAVDYVAMMKVRIGTILLKIVAVLGLFFVGQLTIRNLAIAYVVLYGLYATWLLTYLLPSIGYRLRLGLPDRKTASRSAAFALPMGAANLQLNGDKVALENYGFVLQNGVYGAAYRVVEFGSLPLKIIAQAAFHRFLGEGDESDGYHLRRSASLTAFMFLIGCLAAGAIYVLLPIVEPILLVGDFGNARRMVPWLLLFLPLIGLSSTPMNGLLGLGRAPERAIVFTLAAVVAVVLYIALIPGRGWQGAVVATLVSEAYLALASWIALFVYQRHADRQRRGRLEASVTA